LRLIVVIGVINDNYLAVTRRPEDVVRSLKSFLVNSSSREVSTTSGEGPLTGVVPEALPCSNTSERRQHDETSDGDSGGGEIWMAPVVEFLHRQAKDFPV
jgi:hypothetical protein